MAYTTPPTFSIGQTLPASSLNTLSTCVTELQTGSPAPDTAWTPVLTASTTNPTGQTCTGQYVQFGKIVLCSFVVTIGASAGTGTYTLSLPVTADSSWPSTLGPSGVARYTIGASTWFGWSEVLSTTTMRFAALTASTTQATVTNTVPGTFASGSVIKGTLYYAAA